MSQYLTLPGLSDWIDAKLSRGMVILRAVPPKSDKLWQIGALRRETGAARFLYRPLPLEGGSKAEKVVSALDDWAVGHALTRGGYQRPWIDPSIWPRLLALSIDDGRVVELIAETSALANGSLHFLRDIFQARCRIYLTPVTERELQDLAATNEKKKTSQALAARRFLEQRPPGVVVDTLALDNTPMLLSRGPQRGDKNSESDAMNLRLAREKILDRARGAEPFFVATDTDLIRWATTELPSGRVIAIDSLKARPDTWYLPAEWWPGRADATMNRRMTRTDGGRLIWELLPAFKEGLIVSTGEGDFQLLAHRPGGKMGPTDYQHPWVRVSRLEPPASQPPASQPPTSQPPASQPPASQPPTSQPPASQPAPARPAVPIFFEPDAALLSWPAANVRRRPSVKRLFEGLIDVIEEGELSAELEAKWPDSVRKQVRPILDALGVGRTPDGQRYAALYKCFETGDRDRLAHFLRPWAPFAWAAFGDGEEHAERLRTVAGYFANALGFHWQGAPCPARPDSKAIRAALIEAARTTPRLSARQVLTDIAGDVLKVGPARFLQHWPLMKAAGVFEGFEFEEGGTPDDEPEIWVMNFSLSGWTWTPIGLDAIEGIREFVWKGDAP